MKFDSLADLINRMSSFDQSLFQDLKAVVMADLQPATEYELCILKTYTELLFETELLIQSKKIRNDSVDSADGKPLGAKELEQQE